MSWLSSALHSVGGWVAGDGNTAGNSDTRSLGYDKQKVAAASVQMLNSPAGPQVQQELVVMGIVGLGLIWILRQRR